jgi:uncharacterized protein (TIGR02271 family)
MSQQSIEWNDTIKKEARGPNDEDYGEIQDIGNTYVHTKKGLVNKHDYYLPKYLAEGFDETKVYFRITQDDADTLFANENDLPPADEEYRRKYYDENPEREKLAADIETRIPLMSERLRVNKSQTQTEQVLVKEQVTETKTIEVPVTHEELTVETREVTDDTARTGEFSNEEIRVPLTSEHVTVTKEPYVKEEVVVGKKQVTDTEEVTEKLRSEKVKVKEKE